MPILRWLFGCCFALLALGSSLSEAQARDLEGGARGAVHRAGADSVLRLGPGARARLLARTSVDLGGGGPVPAVAVALENGTLEVTASAPKTRAAVLVRAPGKIGCVVADGRALVIAERGVVTVAARQGEVVVAQGDDWRPLAAGSKRTFGPGETGSAEALLAAPVPRLSRSVALAEGPGARVEWPPVDGAVHYRVRVGTLRSTETRATSSVLERLPPGNYAIDVSAVDRHGVPSAVASAGTLRVVGLELPPGASRSGGVIRLYRGQRARLIGAEGLELSYGTSPYFVAAPRSIGLPPRGGTVVRLRARGGQDAADFRLDPIVVSASVSITPKLARWPDDAIRVRVTPRGAAATEIEAVVSVGARPVRVSWKREGRSLVALVPPARTEGPWVVRVEVRGPRGEIVGRDFVEVAQAGASDARMASRRSH